MCTVSDTGFGGADYPVYNTVPHKGMGFTDYSIYITVPVTLGGTDYLIYNTTTDSRHSGTCQNFTHKKYVNRYIYKF